MGKKTPFVARLRTIAVVNARILRRLWFVKIWGMEIGEGTIVSFGANLDKTNPHGIHIGRYSSVTVGAIVFTHDFINNVFKDVHIGSYCFIGARSIIYPGVTIGDHSIVSVSSVVMKDVPPNCVVAGNPARIVETNIRTGKWGRRHPDWVAEVYESPAPAAALPVKELEPSSAP